MTTFALKRKLYEKFCQNPDLLVLLDNPATEEELNLRIRRQKINYLSLDSTLIPFICFTFIDGTKSNNMLRNKGLLEIEIYAPFEYQAELIYNEINKTIKGNLVEDKIVKEFEQPTGIPGIYCYVVRYQPLVSS